MTINNVALVFGASGISGWAMTKNLLRYPTPSTFVKVIGLTYRPLALQDSGLPQDQRLELHSGINLRSSLDEVKEVLKEKIECLDEVTHVYYLAYSNATAYSEKVMEIKAINVQMTGNAVCAVNALCPQLQSLVLQTGTNSYGVAAFQHIDKIRIDPPLKESNPRIPSPYGDEIFYYAQADLIKEAQKSKRWSWCEVRPDQIIGYVPNSTGMNFLEPIALYLALYRYVHGAGAPVPFLGTKKSWLHTFTESSQDIIARFEIFASLKSQRTDGEAYNIADTETPSCWAEKWPKLCSFFGLRGEGPGPVPPRLEEWFDKHQEEYERMVREYGLTKRMVPSNAWVFVNAGITMLDRSRHLDLTKARVLGFSEELQPGDGFLIAVQRMSSFIPKAFFDTSSPMYGRDDF